MIKVLNGLLTPALLAMIEFGFCVSITILISLLNNKIRKTAFYIKLQKREEHNSLYYFVYGFILSSLIVICSYFCNNLVSPGMYIVPTVTLCLVLALGIKNNYNIALGSFLPTIIFTLCLSSNNFNAFSLGTLFRVMIVFYFILAGCLGGIFNKDRWLTILICTISVLVLSCIFIPFEKEIYWPYFVSPIMLGGIFPFVFYPLLKQWDKVLNQNKKRA